MDPDAGPFGWVDRFAELVAGDPQQVPLDQAALALAAVLRPKVEADAALATLERLADDCPAPTFDGLRRHLFDVLHFAGDLRRYDDPHNSFLDVVLTSRQGLPILLATVMIEVGRRIGVPVVGVGMPMHFLVGDGDDEDRFVDPFTGIAMSRGDARQHFETIAAGRISWDDHHLDSTPARQIVVRMLANLQGSYVRRGDRVRLALVARMRAAVPELADERPIAVRLSGVFN